MKSLQRKRERSLDEPMMDTDRIHYPEVWGISGEQMPEIDRWEVGEEYEITVRVRMRSYDKNETINGVKSTACLELLAYEPEKE